MRRGWRGAGLLLVALSGLGADAARVDPPTLRVVEGHFVLGHAEERPLSPQALRGREFTVADPSLGTVRFRIEAVRPDARNPHGPITLYDIAVYDPLRQHWEPFCTPDPDGQALAIPVTGTWTEQGRYVPLPPGQFTLTCTAGAHAKCLRQGQ